LRSLFADKAWVEFVADFGHAKKFFPDADVFPSVLVVRKPGPGDPPGETQVCVIPRDDVPEKALDEAVAKATYPLPRAHFTRESWTLEPPAVVALLEKLKHSAHVLKDHVHVEPMYGIKTGLNEAFIIDTETRDRLVSEDPACGAVIRQFQRGQDIKRWWSPSGGQHMIVLKSSNDYRWPWAEAVDEKEAEHLFKSVYPSLYRHMKSFEEWTEPDTGRVRGLRHREDQGRWWWELRPCGRVGEDVAILTPHRPGRADFPLPVLHGRASLTAACDAIRDSSVEKVA
jgi:hypothetical protein